jgi:cell division protein FtsA
MTRKDNHVKVMPEDVIFALDIGTRTIIGLVGIQEEDRFIVQAADILEHSSRAMLDGQIHDISKVAAGVRRVKENLEAKLGYTLTRVSIAAAGRVLKTCQVTVERDIEDGREIDVQLVSAIEMEGIQKAQLEIENSLHTANEKGQFYCVGYSVVSYYLNDYIISSLVGHKGHRIGVELLATFLPQMVVDSLYTVIERAGLEVTFLTLEPIAALNVAIPKDLRLLNLALVDIGAGTSDIAITKSGTVIAYAMVPVAGDELTETIAQHYLVDFNMAERIKLALGKGQEAIEFMDILDNKVTVKPDEVAEVIRPTVDELAKTITGKILEYNGGKAPNAVFLVGGGSQARGLSEALSNYIGLSRERVAVRNRSIAKNVVVDEECLSGPDSITPLGILVTTGLNRGQDFFYVTVNGIQVKMYNARKMSVSDALLLAGFNPDQLICKSGKNIKFILNGKDKTLRGSFGKPAEIYVNDAMASLTTMISPGDTLKVTPAEKGSDGSAKAGDFLGEVPSVILKWNGNTYRVQPSVMINDEKVQEDTLIKENDRVDIIMDSTIADIIGQYEIDALRYEFKVNGEIIDAEMKLSGGEIIECVPRYVPPAEPEPKKEEGILDFNAVLQTLSQVVEADNSILVTVNGKKLVLPPKATNYLFIDLFNHIDFDLTNPRGVIQLKLNGRDANYTDIIKTGDVIDIYWRE